MDKLGHQCLVCIITSNVKKLEFNHFFQLDLVNVFEVFLPQLLLYPNATDPLNGYAASVYLRDQKEFTNIVKHYVQKFATPERIIASEMQIEEDEELSSLESYGEYDELIFD